MNKQFKLSLVLSLVVLIVVGCSSAKKNTPAADSVIPANDAPANETAIQENQKTNGINLNSPADSDSNKAGKLTTVYFDFNSVQIGASTKDELTQNSQYLKSNPSVHIQIEGHTDERGGTQYNLALGEKRAKSVKEFLTALGIDGKRIKIISLGKEKPAVLGHDEDSWAKNRRANFVIIGN